MGTFGSWSAAARGELISSRGGQWSPASAERSQRIATITKGGTPSYVKLVIAFLEDTGHFVRQLLKIDRPVRANAQERRAYLDGDIDTRLATRNLLGNLGPTIGAGGDATATSTAISGNGGATATRAGVAGRATAYKRPGALRRKRRLQARMGRCTGYLLGEPPGACRRWPGRAC
jgi:hypothetical protein